MLHESDNLMTIWQWSGVILMVIAIPAFTLVSVMYEMEPMKSDAFGAYQTRVMPWIALFCVGLGAYLSSITIPAIIFLLSIFLAEPVVHGIASILRRNP